LDFQELRTVENFRGIQRIEKIPGLEHRIDAHFEVFPRPEILDPLIEQNDVIIVCGAVLGDEGKGKMVAAIASDTRVTIVERVNSGENAGHTAFDEFGREIIFHLAPSGMLQRNKVNFIGPNCVMDPVSFMGSEIQKLIDLGIGYANLFVGNVSITTPYHKIIDSLGQANSSTLKGISPVHASKVRKMGPRLNDIFGAREHLAKVIQKDLQTYFALVTHSGKSENEILSQLGVNAPKHIADFLRAEDKIEFLIELYERTVAKNPNFPKRADVTSMMCDALERGEKVLLEGPQGYFLSNQVETHWGSSTSADTTASGIAAAAGYNISRYRTLVINVAKTPSSRVGLGANPAGYVRQTFFSDRKINSLDQLAGTCDDFDSIQRKFFQAVQENGIIEPVMYEDANGRYFIGEAMAIASSKFHREKGATTGKPRICGIFDCVLHHKVNQAQGPYLSISRVDGYDDYDKVGLVIAYVVFNPGSEQPIDSNGREYKNGDIIKAGDDVPCENVLKHCHPIVRVMDGWKDNPINYQKRVPDAQLPKQLQNFLGAIRYYTGAEIISIGNGQKTDNLIYLRQVD